MSIGRTNSQAELNNTFGSIVVSLFATMDNIAKAKRVLDTLTVQNLVDMGFTTGDANTLKSAYTDLDKLRTIFNGTATQATTYDFQTFTKLGLGPGLY